MSYNVVKKNDIIHHSRLEWWRKAVPVKLRNADLCPDSKKVWKEGRKEGNKDVFSGGRCGCCWPLCEVGAPHSVCELRIWWSWRTVGFFSSLCIAVHALVFLLLLLLLLLLRNRHDDADDLRLPPPSQQPPSAPAPHTYVYASNPTTPTNQTPIYALPKHNFVVIWANNILVRIIDQDSFSRMWLLDL